MTFAESMEHFWFFGARIIHLIAKWQACGGHGRWWLDSLWTPWSSFEIPNGYAGYANYFTSYRRTVNRVCHVPCEHHLTSLNKLISIWFLNLIEPQLVECKKPPNDGWAFMRTRVSVWIDHFLIQWRLSTQFYTVVTLTKFHLWP